MPQEALYILLIFPVFFVAMWIFVIAILASASGWQLLAADYLSGSEPDGSKRPACSLNMGRSFFPVSYSRCMTMTLSQDALYLQPMRIFQFRHPPLKIPLSHIDFEDAPTLFNLTKIARVKYTPSIKLRFYKREAEWIEAAIDRLT